MAIKQLIGYNWRLLDHTVDSLHGEVLTAFAIEEMECANIAAGAKPLLHLWRHDKALVLGLRDRRLPHAGAAMEQFRSQGWSTAVRNSGGAAVPLDRGVVNVSLILPTDSRVNLHQDFALMAELIRASVQVLIADAAVDAGEIQGAYCPGEYDLSINGYKFCGIAQRRKLGAYVIQAFIVVEGIGASRAKTAAEFYRYATGETESPHALRVEESSTRSLQELVGGLGVNENGTERWITAERFVEAVQSVALGGAGQVEVFCDYGQYDSDVVEGVIAGMKQRYDSD